MERETKKDKQQDNRNTDARLSQAQKHTHRRVSIRDAKRSARRMIEAWGRGTVKIVDECKKAGLPEPAYKEEFGGLSVHFRKADKAQVDLFKWQQEVLISCFYDEKTGKEIMGIAGYGSRIGNFKKGLQRLLDYQLLELTIPDKPKSRLQKYRLTDKGQRLVAGIRLLLF